MIQVLSPIFSSLSCLKHDCEDQSCGSHLLQWKPKTKVARQMTGNADETSTPALDCNLQASIFSFCSHSILSKHYHIIKVQSSWIRSYTIKLNLDLIRYHILISKTLSHQMPCPIILTNTPKYSFVFLFFFLIFWVKPEYILLASRGINVAKTAGEDYESSLELAVKLCVYSGKTAEDWVLIYIIRTNSHFKATLSSSTQSSYSDNNT